MIRLADFTGGLNLRDSNNTLKVNESPDMMNFVIRKRGSIKKRPGTVAVTAPASANALFRYTPNAGGTQLLYATPTAVYNGSTQISATASAAQRSFSTFGKAASYKAVVCSSSHAPLLYDGTTAAVMQQRDKDGNNPIAMPSVSVACSHVDRLFSAGEPNAPWTLYWSEVGYPDRYQSTSWLDVEPYDNAAIVALVPMFDTLVIYKETGVWVLYGTGPSDFALKRVAGTKKVPKIFARTIENIDNLHVLRSTDGVFAFNGTAFEHLSEKIDPALQATMSSTSCAAWLGNEYWMSDGAYTYVANLDNQTWTRHNLACVDMINNDGVLTMVLLDGTVVSTSEAVGTDKGAAISAWYTTPYMDGDNPLLVKDYIHIKPDMLNDGTGLSVEWDIDRGQAHGEFDLTTLAPTQRAVWGTAVWNTDLWAYDVWETAAPMRFPHGSHGERLQLKFKVTGTSPTEIAGIIIHDEPKREVW